MYSNCPWHLLLFDETTVFYALPILWADKLQSKNSEGKVVEFNHPFLQACSMFLGELFCLILFKILVCSGRQFNRVDDKDNNQVLNSGSFNPLIFLPPALCDLTAASTMNIGLNLTYASSFQMLRGAVIVFTGLLSVAFLNKHMKRYEWLGIFTVIVGLICVGLSDVIHPDASSNLSQNNIITGDLLIVMAQIIVATQMVVEEKFITKHNVPPLLGVGWEVNSSTRQVFICLGLPFVSEHMDSTEESIMCGIVHRDLIGHTFSTDFRNKFMRDSPSRSSIREWHTSFMTTGSVLRKKGAGRPRTSDENIEQIREAFLRSQ
ncbi:solute carrier family 35 member F6 [Nephila pilipes]|uniref:Solute carrier family 35 member F6 n=1 Tax=Nephila pilipes TaxID=299642 RepID=A0A8X6Q7P2_NEPPI|nr:solute carrier family 35 member F6 [Nephila pilipes]